MSGFCGDLDDAQAAALAKLKERLEGVLVPADKYDDLYLLRYLRARAFSVDKAEAMFRKMLEFRKQYDMDSIVDTFTPNPAYEKHYPWIYLDGKTKDGYIVLFYNIGNLDPHGLFRVASHADQLRHRLWLSELMDRKIRDTRNGQFVIVIDFERLGTQHLYKPALELFMEISQMDQDYFPENMHAVYFLKAPRIFQLIYGIVKHVFDVNTRKKFQMVPGNPSAKMLEIIDAEYLPARYGGKLSEEECMRRNMFPEKVPKELYRGMDESYSTAEINAGKKFEVKVNVTVIGTQIIWDFVTEENDLGFGVLYQPTPEDDDKRETIIEMKRFPSSAENINGSHEAQKLGCYVCVFDNSFSWFRGKVLRYKVDSFVRLASADELAVAAPATEAS